MRPFSSSVFHSATKTDLANAVELNCFMCCESNFENSDSGSKSNSQQCKGFTKEGKQCTRKTTSANGCCYQHGG